MRTNQLPEKLRPEAIFNRGWAEAEAGQHQDAIATLTRFITEYPKHEFIPKALARRGLSSREVRDLPKAKEDFTRVVKQFPKSEAVEISLLHLGFIHTEMHETKEMIGAFEQLVEKFPSSPAAAQAWFGIGRGCLETKDFDKAVPALKKAMELDKKAYVDKASQLIIGALYAKQNAEELAKAVDAYREANPNGTITPNALAWLGVTLFNKGDFARAARFLTYATQDASAPSPEVLWDHLARAWLELKKYGEADAAIDHVLANPSDVGVKANALLTKSRAQLGLSKFADANQAAEDGLGIIKAGRLQAQLLIQQGDVLYDEGDALAKKGDNVGAVAKWQAAAGKFVVPSQIFVDPKITPEALFKAARALDRAGETKKAEDLLKQLKAKYPDYRPPGYE